MTTVDTRTQTVADLRAAARVQRARGWICGTYLDRASGKVCMSGAIRIAVDASYFDRAEDTPTEVLGRILAALSAAADHTARCHLPSKVGVLSLSWWNDARVTSADEAAALLDAAAAELETEGGGGR